MMVKGEEKFLYSSYMHEIRILCSENWKIKFLFWNFQNLKNLNFYFNPFFKVSKPLYIQQKQNSENVECIIDTVLV
jgi:hypothetical protein